MCKEDSQAAAVVLVVLAIPGELEVGFRVRSFMHHSS